MAKRRHGHARGAQSSSTYMIWMSMRQRCRNPSNRAYERYGQRGITICDRWSEFENFLADMGERPPGLSLERIDNDGPYSPDNCRWATYLEQGRNTRRNRRITYRGETMCVSEWAERLGVAPKTLDNRLNKHGWSVERTLTQGVGGNHRVDRSMISHGGRTQPIEAWAAEVGVSLHALRKRLEAGWPVERALTTPPAPNSKASA